MELFQHFFELIGEELTEMVEESRVRGYVYEPFNSTFLSLIPKTNDPSSFEESRPISLCNCIYKTIAKIIVFHLKPILSNNISKEQFGFLNGRHN